MTSLYGNVIATTDLHLGPTADRFVARQIHDHLGGNPAQLRQGDLERLIDWIQLAMRIVSADRMAVDRYVAELRLLAQPRKGRTHAE